MVVKKNIKPRTLKIVLVLVIVSIMGILTVLYINYRSLLENPEKLISTIKPGVDMTIGDIHQTATRNGKKEWQLDATSAHYIDSEKKVRLDNIDMLFFLKSQQKVHLTANTGILETESQNVSVKGRVELESEDAQLKTEELHYLHKNRFIFSESPVKIIGDAFELSAESMTLDLEDGRAVLKGNVQGTFYDDIAL
jgi:LPS export ABC transporter protein LptC